MILLSNDPREAPARQKFVDILGQEDADALVFWVWETHRAQGIGFCDALLLILEHTVLQGRRFAQNLLDMARKPKHIRDAEMDLMAWVKPRVEKATSVVMGHRGDPSAAKSEFGIFIEDLMAYLRRTYPRTHEATIRGAVMTGCSHKNGAFSVEVHTIIKALDLKDPMSAFYSEA